MSAEDRIHTLIEPVLAPLVVDEVKVTPAGKRRVVRIAVDRATDEAAVVDTATAPMSLDEIADATKAVGAVLDSSDLLGEQPYTLEVTSSGVGRPLTRPRHYQRGVGRSSSSPRRCPRPDRPDQLRRTRQRDLTVPATKKTPNRDHPYTDIARARIEVEFSRPDAATD